jgi:hypothetical protein
MQRNQTAAPRNLKQPSTNNVSTAGPQAAIQGTMKLTSCTCPNYSCYTCCAVPHHISQLLLVLRNSASHALVIFKRSPACYYARNCSSPLLYCNSFPAALTAPHAVAKADHLLTHQPHTMHAPAAVPCHTSAQHQAMSLQGVDRWPRQHDAPCWG